MSAYRRHRNRVFVPRRKSTMESAPTPVYNFDRVAFEAAWGSDVNCPTYLQHLKEDPNFLLSVERSNMIPNAGWGLFTGKKWKKNEAIHFYAGTWCDEGMGKISDMVITLQGRRERKYLDKYDSVRADQV